VGDSNVIISQMALNTTPIDNILASVVPQAKQDANKFNNIKYYHVMWERNHQGYGFANAATSQKVGVININGIVNN
jgi:hypothetical protein